MFHRLLTDEMWHFYNGAPVTVHLIDGQGVYQKKILGGHPGEGGVFQVMFEAGGWFAAEGAGGPVGAAGKRGRVGAGAPG